jgi:hypothetical protein
MSELSRSAKTNLLVANDILSIKSDMDAGDYQFISAIITGEGFTQYNNMTEDELNSEFEEQWKDIKDNSEALELGRADWFAGDEDEDGDEAAFQSLINKGE